MKKKIKLCINFMFCLAVKLSSSTQKLYSSTYINLYNHRIQLVAIFVHLSASLLINMNRDATSKNVCREVDLCKNMV